MSTVARLRKDCPWDRKQTHSSLARYLLEECYEVIDAIHSGDPEKLKEELGDLLLQVVLNAQIASEAGNFDIQEIAQSINKKMIKRHPHVFDDVKLSTAKEVVAQWEELKHKERQANSAMEGITRTLPALLQALKVSQRAAGQGFEWDSLSEVFDQLHSELEELNEAIERKFDVREQELELGDALFTLVNVARWQDLNPEESLLLAIDKFKKRYCKMEQLSNSPLKNLSKIELGELWNRAKQSLDDEGGSYKSNL